MAPTSTSNAIETYDHQECNEHATTESFKENTNEMPNTIKATETETTTATTTTSLTVVEQHNFIAPTAPLSTTTTSSHLFVATLPTTQILASTSTSTPPTGISAATVTGLIKKTPSDFIFGKCIGEGSFSSVYLALGRHDRREYAIKVCDKRHILRERKQLYVRREREILQVMSHTPGFVNLICTFQDNRSLYFVMTYAPNGELLPHIKRVGCFSVECARHYAAELILACEQMHKRNVVHRDLKPENILLDSKMHTLIADFGSAKLLTTEDIFAAEFSYNNTNENQTTTTTSPSPTSSATSLTRSDESDNVFDDDDDDDEATTLKHQQQQQQQRYRHKRKGSFVGTAQYVSPEVLQNMPITTAADLWALGCIVYQMISGMPPFRGYNDFAIFKEILALNFEFPENFDNNAKELVKQLLKMKPLERLGAKDKVVETGYISIRKHAFFSNVDFDNIRKQTPPKICPFLPAFCMEENFLIEDVDFNNFCEEINFILNDEEKANLLEQQKSDKWHHFTENEVILKKGLVNKHKGLFSSKRMLLLTTGPHLIYIDPIEMIKMGEIFWDDVLRVELGNRRMFYLHITNRTHFFEVLEGCAIEWVAAIRKMHCLHFEMTDSQAATSNSTNELDLTEVLFKRRE